MSALAYFRLFIQKTGEIAAKERSLLEELSVPSVCHRSRCHSKGMGETLPPPFLSEVVARGSKTHLRAGRPAAERPRAGRSESAGSSVL